MELDFGKRWYVSYPSKLIKASDIESRARFKDLGYKLEVQGFWLLFKGEGMEIQVTV